MRKLIIFLHTSLDGYAAGPNGEMDWIKFDDTLFDFVGDFTDQADAALYGRVTYDMMEGYWPTAGDQPNASKHSRHHSSWYNRVEKVVVSESLQADASTKRTVISGDLKGNIEKLKSMPGQDIILFGSPSIVRQLQEHNLIDDYWLMLNPVILGSGISLFARDITKIDLELAAIKQFPCGVAALNFKKKNQ